MRRSRNLESTIASMSSSAALTTDGARFMSPGELFDVELLDPPPVTSAAIRLRGETPGRLPLADALIAGMAHSANLMLVHRDPHSDPIPGLKVLRLPDK